MGKQGELTAEEIKFVKARFFRYYRSLKIEGPPRTGLREWGFFLFGKKGMLRPIIFDSDRDLNEFLQFKVPRHSYYSSAYYRKPNMPMDSPEKGWMGADLIFDLDADGIPGAEKMGYEDQLNAVKEEIIRLYDVFLQDHLGFRDDELFLVFSGGRGYHIHIRTPKVLDMDGDERREMMDYVAGSFQRFSDIFPKRRIIRARSFSYVYQLPEMEGGWGGMVRRCALEILNEMERMGEDEAVEFMRRAGIRRDIGKRVYETLFVRNGWEKIRDRGDMGVFRSDSERDNFIKLIEHRVRERYGVHPDVHVTQDTRRLIRLPMSLHGGTGFAVKPMKRDELDDFNPLRDAVPDVYGDEKIGVFVENKQKIRLKENEFRIKGKEMVPEYLAMFLILSGRGSLA